MGFLSPDFEPIDLEEKGYRLTIAVAGLRPGLLEISAIFVPFRKSRSSKLKSFLHSSPRASPLPHSFFFSIKVEGSLSATFANCRGTGHWVVSLFPSISSVPKEDAQLQGTNTDTLELLISPPLFFPSRPSRMDSLSALGN